MLLMDAMKLKTRLVPVILDSKRQYAKLLILRHHIKTGCEL